MHHMILPHSSVHRSPQTQCHHTILCLEPMKAHHCAVWWGQDHITWAIWHHATAHRQPSCTPLSWRSLASDPQRWSKTLKLTTVPPQSGWHLPVWQLILWEWEMGISSTSRTGWHQTDGERECFWWHVSIILFLDYSNIFRICSPDHITNLSYNIQYNRIMTWEFWGQSLVDSNLNM